MINWKEAVLNTVAVVGTVCVVGAIYAIVGSVCPAAIMTESMLEAMGEI